MPILLDDDIGLPKVLSDDDIGLGGTIPPIKVPRLPSTTAGGKPLALAPAPSIGEVGQGISDTVEDIASSQLQPIGPAQPSPTRGLTEQDLATLPASAKAGIIATKAAQGVGDVLRTPFTYETLGIGPALTSVIGAAKASVIGRAISLAFAGQMTASAAQKAGELVTELKKPKYQQDTAKILDLSGGLATDTAFAGGTAFHAATPEVAPSVQLARAIDKSPIITDEDIGLSKDRQDYLNRGINENRINATPETFTETPQPQQTQEKVETNANSQNVNEVANVQSPSESGQVIPADTGQSEGVQRGGLPDDNATQENVTPTPETPVVPKVEPEAPKEEVNSEKVTSPYKPVTTPELTPENSPTSTKNAIVDQERVKRGLPPAMEAGLRDFPEVREKVIAHIDADPKWQDNLIDELRENPRAVTDEENAALLQRQTVIHNDYDKLTRELTQLHESGKSEAIPEARIRLAAISDQLLDLYNIDKRVGTETGRGLNARKMMANEDFSLAQMELGKRAANDGRPLTDSEREQLTKLHDEIKGWQDKYDAHVQGSKEREADLQSKLEIERIKKDVKPVPPHVKMIADRIKATFDARAAAAMKRLQGKTFNLGPEQLADLADLGASKILSGLADFTGWSAEMVRDFGETIKPHLQAVFDAANKAISKELGASGLENARAAQEAIKNLSPEQQIQRISGIVGEKLKAGKKDSVTTYVQKLARLIVGQNPSIDRDGLIDRVHEIVSSVQPGITRSEARDMISGYGDYRQLSKDVISTRLRDLKGQMQQVAKLEAMESGRPPLKSGVEQRIPSREESLLKRQVNDAKREFQVPINDPNTQLKSSLDTLKTRMQTRILDYEKKLAEKDFTTKPKREIKLDSEALRLKSEAERAKQKYLNGLAADRLKKRTPLEKASDTLVKWSRGFLLSGPSTLAKLLSAAAWRLTFNPIEEGIGSGLKRLPYVKEVAARAPIEGRGLNLKTESKALTEGFMKGLQDSVQTVKTGKSVLDNLFGGRRDVGYGEEDESQKSLIDFFGHLHGAIKAPVKRAAFTRAFENQTEFYMSKGVDVSDPMIQTKMAVEAYKRANKDIFMQPNRYSDRVLRFVTSLEEKDKVTGKTPALSKLASTAFKVAVPIVKVPTNIIAETLTYATGLFSGSYHLKQATDILRKGTEELKPEQADLVLSELKKGSIGTAALLLGYFAPSVFGGFYQRGQKRKESDPQYEGARIQGYNIPRNVAHFPLIEAAQTGATVSKVAESRLKKGSIMRLIPAGPKQGQFEGVLAAGLGLAEEVPFIGNVMEMSKAFNPQERQQYLGELLKSRLEPQLISQIAEHYDKDAQGNPIKRKPHTITQSLESGIPGLRKNVPGR